MSTSNQPTNEQLKAAYDYFLADPATVMHADFVQALIQRLESQDQQLTDKGRQLTEKVQEIESLEKI
ncbi:hypothetical protein E8E11_000105, partial [Didymella keratinophila]